MWASGQPQLSADVVERTDEVVIDVKLASLLRPRPALAATFRPPGPPKQAREGLMPERRKEDPAPTRTHTHTDHMSGQRTPPTPSSGHAAARETVKVPGPSGRSMIRRERFVQTAGGSEWGQRQSDWRQRRGDRWQGQADWRATQGKPVDAWSLLVRTRRLARLTRRATRPANTSSNTIVRSSFLLFHAASCQLPGLTAQGQPKVRCS